MRRYNSTHIHREVFRPPLTLNAAQERHIRDGAEGLPAGCRGKYLATVRSKLFGKPHDGEVFRAIRLVRHAILSGAKLITKRSRKESENASH
jgi:hypothetical protein